MIDSNALLPLRQVVKDFDLKAKKSLGQNFIYDENITDKIVKLADLSSHVPVLEVGPGPGGLTRALLKTDVPHVTAVEQDERCLRALKDLEAKAKGRLRLVKADALKWTMDIPSFDIVANLPYNIGTALMLKWCQAKNIPRRMTLMFQKEVADRLTAQPHTQAYGRLSVWIQWQMDVKLLWILPPQVFHPAPKVTSALVQLTPRPEPLYKANASQLQLLLSTAFQQRRKMLKRSLRNLPDYSETWFTHTNIPPDARPEALSIDDFCRLSYFIKL